MQLSYQEWKDHRAAWMRARPPLLGIGLHWSVRLEQEEIAFLGGMRWMKMSGVAWASNIRENSALQILTGVPEAAWERLTLHQGRQWDPEKIRLPKLPRLKQLHFTGPGRSSFQPVHPGLLVPTLQSLSLYHVRVTLETVRGMSPGLVAVILQQCEIEEELEAWLLAQNLSEPFATETVGCVRGHRAKLALGWWALDSFPGLKELSFYEFTFSMNRLFLHPRVVSKEVVLRGFYRD